MNFIKDVLKSAASCMIVIAVMISICIAYIHFSSDDKQVEEPVEKAVLTLDDNRMIEKTRIYDDCLMYPIEYDYSDDIKTNAVLLHVQATDEYNSRKIWKFYKNTDSTVDLVIDFISAYETTIRYDSDPAYMLFKNVTISEIDLPVNNRYLSCNNKWYIVTEVNESIVYQHVDKIVTVDDLMQ